MPTLTFIYFHAHTIPSHISKADNEVSLYHANKVLSRIQTVAPPLTQTARPAKSNFSGFMGGAMSTLIEYSKCEMLV
jgi:hypothetical protein